MIKAEFNWRVVLWRFLMAVLLVAATYNPEGYSYFHWVLLPIYKRMTLAEGALTCK